MGDSVIWFGFPCNFGLLCNLHQLILYALTVKRLSFPHWWIFGILDLVYFRNWVIWNCFFMQSSLLLNYVQVVGRVSCIKWVVGWAAEEVEVHWTTFSGVVKLPNNLLLRILRRLRNRLLRHQLIPASRSQLASKVARRTTTSVQMARILAISSRYELIVTQLAIRLIVLLHYPWFLFQCSSVWFHVKETQ